MITTVVFVACSQVGFSQSKGAISIDFLNAATDDPLICRVQVKNSDGRILRPGRKNLVQGEWSLVASPLDIKAAPGDYTYLAYHGPQFSPASGGFTLDRNSEAIDVVRFERHANLDEEGWYGGDLFNFVKSEECLQWLPAEDLLMSVTVAEQVVEPTAARQISAATDKRWVDQYSFYDGRPGSGLIFHHWSPPANVPPTLPSTRLLVMAKAIGMEQKQASGVTEEALPTHIEIQRLWARDVPIWLASGKVDSVQLLSEHLTYDGSRAASATPLEVPEGHFAGDRGPGRLVERIYWNVLDAGLRLPPTAGSGFGKSPSPLGYNRVYASPGYANAESWWEAIRNGNSFVTSGPLLRVEVNGQRPGELFSIAPGENLLLDVAVKLTVADPVEYLDVIFNGRTLYEARLDEFAREGGRIPPLEIKESGWLIVRVVTERDFTYRIATTAPYYFEVGGEARVSRKACDYFLRWLEKSAQEISGLDEPSQAAAAPYLAAARRFWEERIAAATSE